MAAVKGNGLGEEGMDEDETEIGEISVLDGELEAEKN